MTEERLCVVTALELPSTFPRADFTDRVKLCTASSDEELRTLVRDANILYSWRIPDNVPDETSGLCWIELPSAGADHVRTLPVWNSDVIITSSKGIHTVPMAEHVFAMLLALVRRIPPIVRAQQQQEWIHDMQRRGLREEELRGRTLGIVGWGRIGEGVAHLARAFGMRVVGTRRSVEEPRELPGHSLAFMDPPYVESMDLAPDTVYPAGQLHQMLRQSDIVVSILPLTSNTIQSFGDAEFGAMKTGALFCNMGRGQTVDEKALVRALQSGTLAGAALDVFEQEPLPDSSPLWRMPNVIVSPHVGGDSDHTNERAARLFGVNLNRYLEGQPLLNVVSREREY